MSRVGRQKLAPGKDPRSAILAAAVDILHREGAGALTMRSVASAAGCSTTGVYTWFGGKHGLVEAIFVDGFQRFGDAQRQAQDTAGSESDLVRLGEAYRDWALANPTHYMVMFGGAVPDFVPSDHARAAALVTFERLVTATDSARTDLGIDGEPTEVAYHLWAGIHGYVSLELARMDLAVDAEHRLATFRRGMSLLVRGCLE